MRVVRAQMKKQSVVASAASKRIVAALILLWTWSLLLVVAPSANAQVRSASPIEKAADESAFADVQQALSQRLTDIESVVVVLQGRMAFEFYRDGAPGKLRDVQSVEKSALAALVGIALREGRIGNVDQRVAELVPDWAPLNSDARARDITLRHLLTMTAGFNLKDAAGTPVKLPPAQAWERPLAAAPGEKFVYDNSIVPMLAAVLEKVTGMPLPDFARRHLVQPLELAEPLYQATLHMRTTDMAKLGQLFLSNGVWEGKQMLPPDYVAAATRPQNRGGPPVAMPYGYLWWILPTEAARRTFMASGYGGQLIWVHPPLDMVVAVTSKVSPDSQRRGHAVQLLRAGLVAAAEKRAGEGAR